MSQNVMQDTSSWIRLYSDIVPADFCDQACALFEENHRSADKLNADWRRMQAWNDVAESPLFASLQSYLRVALARFMSETACGTMGYVTAVEAPSVFRYDPADPDGAHRFHHHADAWSMESCSRQLSILLYLNDVAEGGGTHFPTQDLTIQPRKGLMAVFPSNMLFEHAGLEPVSGPKYVLVSWLHFGGVGHAYRVLPL